MWAFAGVVLFHGLNAILFKIGVFPVLMLALTTVFFSPDWCEREGSAAAPGPAMASWIPAVCLLWLGIQVGVPMRSWTMSGPTAWTEEGHRFSWRMKLRSKVGRVVVHALDKERGTHKIIRPEEELTAYQSRRMATRPRMILQYAHHVAERLGAEGSGKWAVHVDSRASLNGRAAQTLIDPKVDLSQTTADEPIDWVVPLQE